MVDGDERDILKRQVRSDEGNNPWGLGGDAILGAGQRLVA